MTFLLEKMCVKTFINYSCYSCYMAENTTIQVSKRVRDQISSFGLKGESFDTVLERIYKLAVKNQLKEFLMSSENCIPIEDARKEVEKKWPRSK